MNTNVEMGLQRAKEFGLSWATAKRESSLPWSRERLRHDFVRQRALKGLPGFSHETRQMLKNAAENAAEEIMIGDQSIITSITLA